MRIVRIVYTAYADTRSQRYDDELFTVFKMSRAERDMENLHLFVFGEDQRDEYQFIFSASL